MRRITTVVTPPTVTALTTSDAIRAELGTVEAKAAVRIPGLIEQASGIITGYLGRELARATIKETFVGGPGLQCGGGLTLSRTPVATLTSIAFNGVNQDLSTLDYDPSAGLVYRHAYGLGYNVPSGGYGFGFSSRIEVTYDGGYLLPGQVGANLPSAIERACIDVVLALWYRAGRGDPMIRSETVDGIGSTQYLDPSPGMAGALPPAAVATLAPYANYHV